MWDEHYEGSSFWRRLQLHAGTGQGVSRSGRQLPADRALAGGHLAGAAGRGGRLRPAHGRGGRRAVQGRADDQSAGRDPRAPATSPPSSASAGCGAPRGRVPWQAARPDRPGDDRHRRHGQGAAHHPGDPEHRGRHGRAGAGRTAGQLHQPGRAGHRGAGSLHARGARGGRVQRAHHRQDAHGRGARTTHRPPARPGQGRAGHAGVEPPVVAPGVHLRGRGLLAGDLRRLPGRSPRSIRTRPSNPGWSKSWG